jgi:hypothetical protein
MLLNIDGENAGIRCDWTGKEFLHKFEYYSVECQKIEVLTSKKAVRPGREAEVAFDISTESYLTLYKIVEDNIIEEHPPNTVKCDLSKNFLTGDFKYWKVQIYKVTVDVEQDPTTSVTMDIDLNISDEMLKDYRVKQKHFNSLPFNPPKTKREVIKIKPKTPELSPKENIERIMGDKERWEKSREPAKKAREAVREVAADPDHTQEPKVREPTEEERQERRVAEEELQEIFDPPPPPPKKKKTIKGNRVIHPRRVHPAMPEVPELEVEIKPEVTKVELPNTGIPRNVKKRKKS